MSTTHKANVGNSICAGACEKKYSQNRHCMPIYTKLLTSPQTFFTLIPQFPVFTPDGTVLLGEVCTPSTSFFSSLSRLLSKQYQYWSGQKQNAPELRWWNVSHFLSPGLSTPLSFKMLWCSDLSKFRKFRWPLSTSALPRCRPVVIPAQACKVGQSKKRKIMAFFRKAETVPFFHDSLKSSRSVFLAAGPKCLIMPFVTPSGPDAFLHFNCLIATSVSFMVMGWLMHLSLFHGDGLAHACLSFMVMGWLMHLSDVGCFCNWASCSLTWLVLSLVIFTLV